MPADMAIAMLHDCIHPLSFAPDVCTAGHLCWSCASDQIVSFYDVIMQTFSDGYASYSGCQCGRSSGSVQFIAIGKLFTLVDVALKIKKLAWPFRDMLLSAHHQYEEMIVEILSVNLILCSSQ